MACPSFSFFHRKAVSSPTGGRTKKKRLKGKLGVVGESGTTVADTSNCATDTTGYILLDEYRAAAESANDDGVIDLTLAESAIKDNEVVIDLTGEEAVSSVGRAAKSEGELTSSSKVKKKKKRVKRGRGDKRGCEEPVSGKYEVTSGKQGDFTSLAC